MAFHINNAEDSPFCTKYLGGSLPKKTAMVDANMDDDTTYKEATRCCEVFDTYTNQANLDWIMEMMKFSIGTTLPMDRINDKTMLQQSVRKNFFPNSSFLSTIQDNG